MFRSRAYPVAAVLLLLYCLLSVVFTFPDLARGAPAFDGNTNGPPYAITVVEFVTAVLGFVAAYGVWRVERWGVVLTLAICAIQVITGLPGAIFAPAIEMQLLSVLGVVWCAVIVVLLLRAGPRPAEA